MKKNVAAAEATALDPEYIDRVIARLEDGTGSAKRASRAWFVARSAEDHFARVNLAVKRLVRAKGARDKVGMAYEQQVVSALMYEIADTAYLVMLLLDFNQLDLSSSTDGSGFVGEVAPDVVRTISLLDNQAVRLIELEKATGIAIDFSEAVDEKEGITYQHNRHWQDLIPGSVAESFFTYFIQAHEGIRLRLAQKPEIWVSQTVRQYLEMKRHTALLNILERLEAPALKKKVSK